MFSGLRYGCYTFKTFPISSPPMVKIPQKFPLNGKSGYYGRSAITCQKTRYSRRIHILLKGNHFHREFPPGLPPFTVRRTAVYLEITVNDWEYAALVLCRLFEWQLDYVLSLPLPVFVELVSRRNQLFAETARREMFPAVRAARTCAT